MKQAEPSPSEGVLTQLAEGTAWFEFVETWEFEPSNAPFASIAAAFSRVHRKETVSSCFAKIGGIRNLPEARPKSSPALKSIEYFTVERVAGDGRCMFRALVLGMAANKGARLNSYEEEQEAARGQEVRCVSSIVYREGSIVAAVFLEQMRSVVNTPLRKGKEWIKDQLRQAVADAICRSDNATQKYEEALIAITVEESLQRYCQRIPSPRFWGGESELLVLSRMCNQPIVVYIPESEAKRDGRGGGGYVPIAEYGSEFRNPRKGKKPRKAVRLLYSGSNHYDLLV